MTQLLEHKVLKDYVAIAAAVSNELAASAVARDRQAGAPDEEIQRLRNTTTTGTIWHNDAPLAVVSHSTTF